ncbi:MAG: TerB family tellurite resistance protein [Phycisphaerales bacterium]|nr:TerB family tellurite resistance protein [Phycisphaerales bacterium]
MKHAVPLMEQVAVLRAACCIAAADGEITADERQLLENLAEKAGVGRASREAMIDQALTSPAFLESQFRVLVKDPERAIKVLLIVASVDGSIGESESHLVETFSRRLSIEPEQVERLLRAGEEAADRKAANSKDEDG